MAARLYPSMLDMYIRALMSQERPQSEAQVLSQDLIGRLEAQRMINAPVGSGATNWDDAMDTIRGGNTNVAGSYVPPAMVGLRQRLLNSTPTMPDQGEFWNEQRFGDWADMFGLQRRASLLNPSYGGLLGGQSQMNPYAGLLGGR